LWIPNAKRHGSKMPKPCVLLTDTAIRNAKPRAKTYTLGDGEGMYLEVMPNGTKFWRMAYRQPNGKNNRLTFGKYPEVSLAEARDKRLAARKQLAQGVDPGRTKREEKQAREKAALNTFEAVARAWLARTAAERAASTQEKNTAWLERNIFPAIGALPISTIKPWDVLSALRVIEKRGAIESAHKIKQLCGQVFRFAVASGLADRDMTVDLRGALSAVRRRTTPRSPTLRKLQNYCVLLTLTTAMPTPSLRSSWRRWCSCVLGSYGPPSGPRSISMRPNGAFLDRR